MNSDDIVSSSEMLIVVVAAARVKLDGGRAYIWTLSRRKFPVTLIGPDSLQYGLLRVLKEEKCRWDGCGDDT